VFGVGVCVYERGFEIDVTEPLLNQREIVSFLIKVHRPAVSSINFTAYKNIQETLYIHYKRQSVVFTL